MSKGYNMPCNIAKTLDLIGDRWTLLIIRDLLTGRMKFNDLKLSLSGISPNILSERLQFLEQEGIVYSNLYSLHPPRYEYGLTDKGRALRHVVNALAIWGNRFLQPKYRILVHEDCGHEVRNAYYCPCCGGYVKNMIYRDADAPSKKKESRVSEQ
jgi:DNA-binding HxlR family transcriptional regulator